MYYHDTIIDTTGSICAQPLGFQGQHRCFTTRLEYGAKRCIGHDRTALPIDVCHSEIVQGAALLRRSLPAPVQPSAVTKQPLTSLTMEEAVDKSYDLVELLVAELFA
jgi:hypothetical protein